MGIPDYINCTENETPCDWFFHNDCKSTCPYVSSLGIGACCDPGVFGRLEKEIEDDGRAV